ncbi:MAG: ABC transporter substrate-binding protein [Candidatus Enterenecus sp.]
MKKRWIALLACMAMLLALVATACSSEKPSSSPSGTSPAVESNQPSDQPSDEPGGFVQGVTDTEILVGNTATTAGAYAAVGVPFNAGLQAALKVYNDAGGYQGKTVRLINYNDDFDAANGLTYTQKLVEDDKIFALVGHFGTPTVGATLDYIKEKGIPMVYAATGISELYNENATGSAAVVFSVQPIFDAEGRVLLARALASAENGVGLGGTKIGCISTTDDAGEGLKAGVERQAKEASVDVIYQEVQADATDYSAAISVLKNAGCDVVIIAANQAPMAKIMNAMRDANFNAKCITSYVNASAVTMGNLVDDGSITADRPLYATAWLDTSTEAGMNDYYVFYAAMQSWETENNVPAEQTYVLNSYAMAGYIAGTVFTQGMQHLEELGLELTWENYVKALEMVVPIPMGGTVDFTNGQRLGIVDLALNTISLDVDETTGYHSLQVVSPIMSLNDVWAEVK